LPRPAPVPEPVETAWVGVTSVYPAPGTPAEVVLRWERFDLAPTVPATVTDPESSRSVELSAGSPSLRWENDLAEDPAPVVRAVHVEPVTVWLPPATLALLGVALVCGWLAVRGRRPQLSIAAGRIALAGGLLLAPVGGVSLALPWSVAPVPDAARAERILGRVLPNVYRAFEYPTESAVYDRLALSVTGDALAAVYLENRRAVRMEERGGARARIEAVEVERVTSVESVDTGGFAARAVWTLGGTVTHFGHRHFRQNRYDALVVVTPVDGLWKIRSIELLDEARLR
jgi:hypothetical protein